MRSQIVLASGEVERRVGSVGEVRGFLNAVFGGRVKEGGKARHGFDAVKGG